MNVVAFPQRAQVRGDLVGFDRGDLRVPGRGEVRGIAGEVTAVGGEGVRRDAPLDTQVRQIGPAGRVDRTTVGGGAGGFDPAARFVMVCGQESTSSSLTAPNPCAAATGPEVSRPAWVLRPNASERSLRSASRQPWLANSTA